MWPKFVFLFEITPQQSARNFICSFIRKKCLYIYLLYAMTTPTTTTQAKDKCLTRNGTQKRNAEAKKIGQIILWFSLNCALFFFFDQRNWTKLKQNYACKVCRRFFARIRMPLCCKESLNKTNRLNKFFFYIFFYSKWIVYICSE